MCGHSEHHLSPGMSLYLLSTSPSNLLCIRLSTVSVSIQLPIYLCAAAEQRGEGDARPAMAAPMAGRIAEPRQQRYGMETCMSTRETEAINKATANHKTTNTQTKAKRMRREKEKQKSIDLQKNHKETTHTHRNNKKRLDNP